MTLANSVLRLYVGTLKPTDALVTIVTFILRVYAPTWFNVKLNNKCVNGSYNLWFLIKASSYLSQEHKEVVNKSIQTNAFFGHHENILLGMIRDKNKKIRELACERILKARSQNVRTESSKFQKLSLKLKLITILSIERKLQ